MLKEVATFVLFFSSGGGGGYKCTVFMCQDSLPMCLLTLIIKGVLGLYTINKIYISLIRKTRLATSSVFSQRKNIVPPDSMVATTGRISEM